MTVCCLYLLPFGLTDTMKAAEEEDESMTQLLNKSHRSFRTVPGFPGTLISVHLGNDLVMIMGHKYNFLDTFICF